MDATPLTIVPLKRNAPASVAMVTLCGMAASLLVNAIPNGTPAGPVIELGEKRKSRASTPRTTGATVGLGVGLAVGLAVGLTVGLGVGFAVGVSAGVDGRVGAGVAVGLGAAPDAAGGGVVATGDAVALGESVGEGPPFGAAVGARLTAALEADADAVVEDRGAPVRAALEAAPPHATGNRQMTTSSSPAAPCGGVRETGTAAL